MPVCWVGGVGFSVFVFVMGVSQFDSTSTSTCKLLI